MSTYPFVSIVIATANPGKIREMKDLLREVPCELKDLSEFTGITEINETGSTFTENAELKAAGYARQTLSWSLADDSGLEVAALNGAPGVLSARYGGVDTPFPAKIALLLKEMEGSGSRNREARFVCSMALSDDAGNIRISAEGECKGVIAAGPRGSGGFGYDPVFIPDGYRLTFGELPDAVKGKISHRSKAAAKIIRYLLDFTGFLT